MTLPQAVLDRAREDGADDAFNTLFENEVETATMARVFKSAEWDEACIQSMGLEWVMERCGLPRSPVDKDVVREWGAAYTEGANKACEDTALVCERFAAAKDGAA